MGDGWYIWTLYGMVSNWNIGWSHKIHVHMYIRRLVPNSVRGVYIYIYGVHICMYVRQYCTSPTPVAIATTHAKQHIYIYTCLLGSSNNTASTYTPTQLHYTISSSTYCTTLLCTYVPTVCTSISAAQQRAWLLFLDYGIAL